MRPDARVAAVIEIVEQVLEGLKPLDTIISEYFKVRRFAGSKDRRAISNHVYRIVRNQGKIQWLSEKAELELNARQYVLIDLKSQNEDVFSLFSGEKFAPAPLNEAEQNTLQSVELMKYEDFPNWAKYEYPQWLENKLEQSIGNELPDLMMALNEKAPMDLRINRFHENADQAFEILSADIDDLEKTPHSPMGLRTHGTHKINGIKAYKSGLVDIQDESAQVASLLCDAKDQDVVIDFCAGAGGKTLAIGAEMENKGALYALDISSRRLHKMRPRLLRAGINNVIIQPIKNEQDPWLKQFEGRADRVFIDAPCSGSGTWRRQPENRWKLTTEKLEDYKGRQTKILTQAAHLIKQGGRLIYATCSVLASENQDQIENFLSTHSDFKVIPPDRIWEQISNSPLPIVGPYLNFYPHKDNCDGFFCAILEKSPYEFTDKT